jgi:predicted house-cleaning noncanonical NTP pyrophosphatase (MazG superfamily)
VGEIIYNKLVRGKIPEIIRADGHEAITHIVPESEQLPVVLDKNSEEAEEVRESGGDLGELADNLATLKAVARAKGYTWEQVEQAEIEKAESRGGFEEWIFLEKVIIPEDNK